MKKTLEKIIPYFVGVFILCISIMTIISEDRVKEKKEAEQEEIKRLQEKYGKVERFRQPMVRNGGSLKFGYYLLGADLLIDEAHKEVAYLIDYDTQEKGLRVFDSLFMEICKHHCDSIAPHHYTNKYNRVFECSKPGASITLRYKGRNYESEGRLIDYSTIEITYLIPQKQSTIGEEWEQYLRVE